MRRNTKSGFTLIELMVTIVVISILIGVARYGVGTALARSRNEERRVDTSNLAMHLDSAYISGFSGLGGLKGRYPSTQHATTNGVEALFRGIDTKNLKAPGSTGEHSIAMATNGTQTPDGVRPIPTETTYVYQPINSAGGLCTSTSQECRKFNIFYKLENNLTIQKITSKNQ